MKVKKIFAIAVIGIFAILGGVSVALADGQYSKDTLEEVQEYIDRYYPFSVSQDEMYKDAVKGMLDSLHDPYTEYFTKEDFDSFLEDINQELTGVGVEIINSPEGGKVLAVIPGSPAEAAGLKSNDIITAVDGKAVQGMQATEIAQLVRGAAGTAVVLEVKHPGGKIETYNLTRGKIDVPQVESKMLDSKTGYIRILTFGDKTVDDFKSDVAKLKEDGMQQLIIDLRGNGGGYLKSAMEIAELFTDGPSIYLQGKDGQMLPQRAEPAPDLHIPAAVVVDQGSASSSEVLAACLKDNGYPVVGTRTFGKGVVQQVFQLKNGDYLKLTVASYYSPHKTPVNGQGVTPNYVVENPDLQLIRAEQVLNPDAPVKLSFAAGSDAYSIGNDKLKAPATTIKQDGKIFVPLRTVLEAIGADISWEADSGTAKFALEGMNYSINFADKTFTINGVTVHSTADIQNLKGTTMVSTHFLQKLSGIATAADDKGNVIITYKN